MTTEILAGKSTPQIRIPARKLFPQIPREQRTRWIARRERCADAYDEAIGFSARGEKALKGDLQGALVADTLIFLGIVGQDAKHANEGIPPKEVPEVVYNPERVVKGLLKNNPEVVDPLKPEDPLKQAAKYMSSTADQLAEDIARIVDGQPLPQGRLQEIKDQYSMLTTPYRERARQLRELLS